MEDRPCKFCGQIMQGDEVTRYRCYNTACITARELTKYCRNNTKDFERGPPKRVQLRDDVWEASLSSPLTLYKESSQILNVCIVAMDDMGKFVMLRRANSKKWEFPGGTMRSESDNVWIFAIHMWQKACRQELPLLQDLVMYVDWHDHTRVFFVRVMRHGDKFYEGRLSSKKHDEIRTFHAKDSMWPLDLVGHARGIMDEIKAILPRNEPINGDDLIDGADARLCLRGELPVELQLDNDM